MRDMRLYSALLPPREALAEVAEVVRSVAPETRELDPVPLAEMHIPVTQFGNVTLADARSLRSVLSRDAAGWPAPKLHFAGAAALEWRGDQSVWAKLAGDLDGLAAITRGVADVVRRLGFFVDRRAFRPMLSVGTITDHTTAPYLERLVEALDRHEGRPWQLEELHVLRRLPVNEDGSEGGYETFETFRLRVG
jgi:2'-5' RNA ligase